MGGKREREGREKKEGEKREREGTREKVGRRAERGGKEREKEMCNTIR